MSERTAVYRLYDANDTLLYVGISKTFGERWQAHAVVQPWWNDVDHQTVEWQPTREDALLAEKKAMAEERPVYNRRGSPWVATVRDDGSGFDIAPKVKVVRKRTGTRGTQREAFRIDPDLWRDYKLACDAAGTNRSADLRAHAIATVQAWKAGDGVLSNTPERD